MLLYFFHKHILLKICLGSRNRTKVHFKLSDLHAASPERLLDVLGDMAYLQHKLLPFIKNQFNNIDFDHSSNNNIYSFLYVLMTIFDCIMKNVLKDRALIACLLSHSIESSYFLKMWSVTPPGPHPIGPSI